MRNCLVAIELPLSQCSARTILQDRSYMRQDMPTGADDYLTQAFFATGAA